MKNIPTQPLSPADRLPHITNDNCERRQAENGIGRADRAAAGIDRGSGRFARPGRGGLHAARAPCGAGRQIRRHPLGPAARRRADGVLDRRTSHRHRQAEGRILAQLPRHPRRPAAANGACARRSLAAADATQTPDKTQAELDAMEEEYFDYWIAGPTHPPPENAVRMGESKIASHHFTSPLRGGRKA